MSGPYTVFCQRCDRPSVTRKLSNERSAWIFGAASDRPSDEVRLCASCLKTIEAMAFRIARVTRASRKRWRAA